MAKARRGAKRTGAAKKKRVARKRSGKRVALTSQAVYGAIAALKDRKGSSAKAILAYLKAQPKTKRATPLQVRVALARGIKSKAVVRSGASYKLRRASTPTATQAIARRTRSKTRSRSRSRSGSKTRSSKSRSRSKSKSRSRSRSKSPGRKSVKKVTKAKRAKKVVKRRKAKARRGKAAAKRRVGKKSRRANRRANKRRAAPKSRKVRRKRRRSARKWTF